ncbi:MAG: bifunctional DNA primase/polymerase [Nitrospirota bacterium]|nr:bifunctional DNA primase/polymerase [Nitrospirota bacterium]
MSDVLKEARRLYKAGFAIIWLHPKSKRPVESKWTTGERKIWAYLESTYKEGYNVGVRTGTPSKLKAGYLACIDVDIQDPAFEEAAMKVVEGLVGHTPMPEVRSGSGNGSRHLYCVTPEPFKMITVAKSTETVEVKGKTKHKFEVCIYSDGRQMALPPSIHPDTGKAYRWEYPMESELPEFDFANVKSVSASVNKKAGKAGKAGGQASEADGGGAQLGREATEADFEFHVSDVDLDWLPISAKVLGGIKHGTNIVDRSSFLLPAATALHTAGLDRNEILSVLTDPRNFLSACAYDHAQTKDRARAAHWLWKYTIRKIFAERSATSVFSKVDSEAGDEKLSPEDAEKQTEELLSEINWRQNLDRTKQGKLTTSLKNLDLIFSHAVEGNVFVKDLFANRVIYGANAPWGGKAQAPLEDIDLILVKRWLADAYGIEPATNAVLEATSLVGHKQRIHPVRDWLETLEWDGTPRVDTWLKDYCEGIAEEPYLSQVSRKFLLAMVKRVFEPGCQWDYVLVLEGKQGRYKSSIARALASDRWFMDNLPDLKDKDAMLNLQGKWLIELGELTSVKRSDYNLVKAYLVRRTDTVRPHYGRIQADVPRQSVFIGTVNEGQYLKDPTGNRRYWPVKVGTCDVKGLSAVRDQLFAEAMHIYRETGEILMLDEVANEQAAEAQEDRRVEDDESEMRDALKDFIESDAGKEFNFERFRVRELFEGVGAPWGRFADKSYTLQTGTLVLTGLGFERHKIGGQRLWRKSFVEGEKPWGRPLGQTPHLGQTPLPHDAEADFL